MPITEAARFAGRAIAPRRLQIIRSLLVGLLAPWMALGPAWAQSSTSTLQDLLRSLDSDRTNEAQVGPGYSAPPWSLEASLDRKVYRLIPGDRIHVGIWGESPVSHLLGVTPDGMLVIPKVGRIEVAGQTLESAERAVTEALTDLYPRARVTLTLLEPGRFRNLVTGMVANPGVYESMVGDRLSMALRAAGGISPGGTVRRIRIFDPIGTDTASRSTAVSESPREVDLLPWLVRADLDANPVLQPGQVIEVAPQEETVSIRGAINGRNNYRNPDPVEGASGNRPPEEPALEIEWREGDTFGWLLETAGGASQLASGTATIERPGQPIRKLDLDDAADLAFPLEPGDRIEVEAGARWIYVVGSVRSPGRYPYYPGYSAEEYVLMAGGTTELGRETGWEITRVDGEVREIDGSVRIEPGTKLRVPETRVQKVNRYLGPLTSAAALALSIIAIANR